MDKQYSLRMAYGSGAIAIYGESLLDAIKRAAKTVQENACSKGYTATCYKAVAITLSWRPTDKPGVSVDGAHAAVIYKLTNNHFYTAVIDAKRHEVPEAHYDFAADKWVVDQAAPQAAMSPTEFRDAIKRSGKRELRVGNTVLHDFALMDFERGIRDVTPEMAAALSA